MSLREDFLAYQAKTTPHPLGIEVERASGSYIYDTAGKAYLDFVAGVSACSLGHCHPAVVNAMERQMQKYLHVMVYGEFAQEPSVRLSKELITILPKNHELVYLTNSGTEAVEGALKLAKRFTGRSRLVAAKNSYHGSTQGALSVTGQEPQKKAYRPLLPGVDFIAFNALEDLERINDKTAAVILETIQGGAGFVVPNAHYLKAVQQRCVEVGALLILDEIQPGFGRTGKWFAFEYFDISPDILVMGKGMGGGMPIGAFSSSKEIMSVLEEAPKLGHITTFGGHPVIASAALATIEEIKKQQLISQIVAKEKLLRENLQHPKIKSIKGKGLMLALFLENPKKVNELILGCLDEGLLLFWLLWEKRAARISPPLTISHEEIEKGCATIKKVLDRL